MKKNATIEDIVQLMHEQELRHKQEQVEQTKRSADFDRRIKEISAMIDRDRKNGEKSDRKIDKLSEMLGGHLRNAGDSAEEFFYRGLLKKQQIGDKKFDSVRRNIILKQKEYDIIMLLVNGTEVMVIEVKNKLHKNDIDKFISKDLPRFRIDYREFASYQLLGCMAALHVSDEAERYAEEKGLFVLTQSGENPLLLNPADFEPQIY